MKLTFTLNELESFALNTARWDEYYSMYRSYTGIPVGAFCHESTAYNDLRKEFIVCKDEWQDEYIMIRGKRFDLSILDHAYLVVCAMIDLKTCLNALHVNGSASAVSVRKARKLLVALLQLTEW